MTVSHRFARLALAVALAWTGLHGLAAADELLVADRLTNRILRYSASGAYLGVVTDDASYLSEPNGMALDGSMLYVANRQNNSVVGFNFDGITASDPPVVINTGLNVPASILIDDSAEVAKLYVSNLGVAFDGATVAQFHLDGATAGDDLTGGGPTGRSGLAFAPDGSLLVSGFQSGEVLKYNAENAAFETFIGPNQALMGAGNLLIDGNSLYVAAGFTGMVMKFDATTGQPDPAFTPIAGLEFPASLALAPDGNGILVGVLGFANGAGRIDQFAADGAFIGTWAGANQDPNQGFVEATGLLVIPSPEGAVGDTDGDADIDLDDLNSVRNHFGATGAADGSLDGDAFPFDGIVDLDDLNGVRNNFGSEIIEGSPSSVPEPSAVSLVLCSLAGMGLVVGRRRA